MRPDVAELHQQPLPYCHRDSRPRIVPRVRLPAGRTTISGQARQSRKTVLMARGAAFACATACGEVVKLQASASMMGSFFISAQSGVCRNNTNASSRGCTSDWRPRCIVSATGKQNGNRRYCGLGPSAQARLDRRALDRDWHGNWWRDFSGAQSGRP
jgi:hypothetical protein